jgi:hypothetical protein
MGEAVHKKVYDDFMFDTRRSALYSVAKQGSPPDPSLLTSGGDHYNGVVQLQSLATGSTLVEMASNTSGFTVAEQVEFYARIKMPAYSVSEKDLMDIGLQDSSSFNAYLQFLIYYGESPQNYWIYARPNSGSGETGYNTGVALPTGGGSTGWVEINMRTYGTGSDLTWELSKDGITQARGTIPSSVLPTLSLRPYFRVGKPATGGSRITKGYLDYYSTLHNAA